MPLTDVTFALRIQALYTDPTQKFVLFHRSLCWVVLKKENRAFSDFKGCLALSPSPEEKELRADFEDNELEASFRYCIF